MRSCLRTNPDGRFAGDRQSSVFNASSHGWFCAHATRSNSRGYSLVELVIVVALVVTVGAIAIPSYTEMIHTAKVVSAMGDIKQIQFEIENYQSIRGGYPESLAQVNLGDRLDPWGQPYVYFLIKQGKNKPKAGGARKDKNLVPLNSDYDLYSMGRDGKSVPPITGQPSWDDIIRANNGGFIGLAKNY